MAMRLGVLTTDTPHHRYFLREVQRRLPEGVEIVVSLFEDRPYPWRERALRHFRRSLPNLWRATVFNPYVQSRRFAARQLAWEEATFFPDGDRTLPPTIGSHMVGSVNDSTAAQFIEAARPDALFVYGTGLVGDHVFGRPPLGAFNAHGGLLPGYRGLDTNLWAALEGRPEEMAVTLHKVDTDYDTGPVYAQRRLGRIAGLDVLTLRYHTTLVVIELTLELLPQLAAGRLAERVQSGPNRYYGPMPHVLKRRADRMIRAYAASAERSVAA
jgi:formyl transferase-like protein